MPRGGPEQGDQTGQLAHSAWGSGKNGKELGTPELDHKGQVIVCQVEKNKMLQKEIS